MLISINWLKNYIEIDDLSTDQIVEYITNAGLEVEEVTDYGKRFENMVVGFVKERKKHPNADKLSVCLVNDGEKDYNVVCGAPNVDAGQKVPFAKVGAIIPNGNFEIKKAKIRGEVSEGMICAEDELGLGEDHSGIMVLDPGLQEGTKLSKALGLDDVVMEISITPNRSEALSHYGIARDLAAILDRESKLPKIELNEEGDDINKLGSIEIENSVDCPRYSAKVVTGIKIQESPDWLKQKLIAVGSRPINNVVDVTNYILNELGQPLHAFDLKKLAGNKIVVKSAGNEIKKFTTLDSKERNLNNDDLLIWDGEKPVAIAGVMGGENSEVTETTLDVLIESAYFRPSAVRKTSKQLGLSTDASYRFERGTNPDLTLFAAERAAQLIAEVAGGKIAKGFIDAYPNKILSTKIELRHKRISLVLGFDIDKSRVESIMTNLGFTILEKSDEKLLVEVPPFRHDIEREIDLIEEVIRVYGYDNIPLFNKVSVTLDAKVNEYEFADNSRNILVGLGLNEIITNSLLNQELADEHGKSIPVLSPQSYEMSNLRTSLLTGMLQSISKNIKVKENDLALFEIGRIFTKINEELNSFEDFTEEEHLLIAITGNCQDKEWYGDARKYDFYDLKGIVNAYIKEISLDNQIIDSYYQEENLYFEYNFAKMFFEEIVGKGGKLKNSYLKNFDIKQDVFVFDFNITKLKKINKSEKSFNQLLKYPKVKRDFAVVVDKDNDSETIINVIEKNNSKLLKNVKLFDIFESDSLGKGKKSLAFELEYFDEQRTLTEEEVEKEFWNAIEAVKKEFNASLRG
ncbi:MAG: phenylalanine--tRNA ligase subunit beta [Ignavibacteriae bacterium]|nr:phenylalanine--tRNA ligase subunit beta [Ignavibacteriota bacterium]